MLSITTGISRGARYQARILMIMPQVTYEGALWLSAYFSNMVLLSTKVILGQPPEEALGLNVCS